MQSWGRFLPPRRDVLSKVLGSLHDIWVERGQSGEASFPPWRRDETPSGAVSLELRKERFERLEETLQIAHQIKLGWADGHFPLF
jgi:hypothetical protein